MNKFDEINDGMDFIENMSNEELNKFIDEICDEELKPDYGVKKILNTNNYEFQIKQYIYHVEIVESIIISNNKKIISIKFKLMNGPNQPNRNNFQTDQQYQIALQKSQLGITGTGNPMAVFRKVIGAIINMLKDINPNYVTFSADENNRRGLYDKIIKTIQKYIPLQYK